MIRKCKKSLIVVVIATCVIIMNTVCVFAYSYTFSNCPNSGPYVGTNYNYNKAYNNHKYYPGDNYEMVVDTSGGRFFIIHETWNCKYCGKFIAKDTVQDVSTPSSSEDKEK